MFIGSDAACNNASTAAAISSCKAALTCCLPAHDNPGTPALEGAIREVLGRQLAKWCVPDEVVYVAEIPHTATGKISKLTLRKMFDGHRLQQQPRSRL
jgi:acyl-coenzyme A synthetase/AMP-(fatty) acid ligase